MSNKTRLTQLASRLAASSPDQPAGGSHLDANPPHGTKGNFLKVTVTLPPAVYERLAQEAMRRKMAKESNPLLSAIIREAVVAYLDTETIDT